jgi:hypothetical protein
VNQQTLETDFSVLQSQSDCAFAAAAAAADAQDAARFLHGDLLMDHRETADECKITIRWLHN